MRGEKIQKHKNCRLQEAILGALDGGSREDRGGGETAGSGGRLPYVRYHCPYSCFAIHTPRRVHSLRIIEDMILSF